MTLPSIVWLLITFLATWRITSILHHEDIAAPFRAWLGVQEEGDLISYPDTFLGHLIECFWCTSVWVGLVCAAIMLLLPYILLPFALSAGAIMIERALADGDI